MENTNQFLGTERVGKLTAAGDIGQRPSGFSGIG